MIALRLPWLQRLTPMCQTALLPQRWLSLRGKNFKGPQHFTNCHWKKTGLHCESCGGNTTENSKNNLKIRLQSKILKYLLMIYSTNSYWRGALHCAGCLILIHFSGACCSLSAEIIQLLFFVSIAGLLCAFCVFLSFQYNFQNIQQIANENKKSVTRGMHMPSIQIHVGGT